MMDIDPFDASDDDTADRGSVSRRRLLSALGAAGATGIGTGATAAHVFGDAERVDSALEAGALDVRVHWEILDGPGAGRGGTSEGAFRVPIEYDADHRRGAVLLRVDHAPVDGNNPAAVWLRGSCPESLGTLGEVATVTLSYADCETGDPVRLLTEGSMREVVDDLASGIALDGEPGTDGDGCLHPDAPACLRLEWDLGGYVGGESATLSLEAIASQCRHADRSSPPFSPADPCQPADPCPCCLDVGTLELEAGGQPGIGENTIEPGRYSFTEGASEYRLQVTDTETKDDGETVAMAFELRYDGAPGPTLCRVDVAGGPGAGRGPGVESYEPASDGRYGSSTTALTTDATGLLYARRRTGSTDGSDEYHAISHVTVAICAADGRCD